MSMRRPGAIIMLAILTSGCFGGSEQVDDASTSTSAAAATTSAASAPGAGLIALQLEPAGAAVEGLVDADVPIDITVPFADGSNAVVHVPPSAMEAGRVIRAAPVVDTAGDVGIVFEPAGAWLDRPITVTFSAVGTPLARYGRTDDELLFGRGAVTTDGDMVLARLRPIVIATDPATASAVDSMGDLDDSVGDVFIGRGPDGIDPIDELAGEDERDETERPDGATARGADAKAGAVGQLKNPRCATYGDTKEMAELVELARKEPNVQIPECVEVIVRVSGLMDAQIEEFDISEYAIGERTVVATKEGGTETIPLQGTEHGWAALRSVSMSGWVNGVTKYAEVQFGPMLPTGMVVPDPPPVADSYCQDANLRDGSLTVTTKIVDGSMLHVEVMPTPGVYPITCQAPFTGDDTPSLLWDYLRLVLGLSETAPFVLDAPITSPVMRLVDSLQQLEEVSVRRNGDGTVTVSEANMVVRLGLTLAVSFAPLDDEPKTLG